VYGIFLLSQKNIVMLIEMSKCLNNRCSQTTSLATKDKTRYFNSAKNMHMIPCWIDFHEIRESLRKT